MPFVAFHFGLLQDVAVLRPVARLAASMRSLDIRLLVAEAFVRRDADGRWMRELESLGVDIDAPPFIYDTPLDALHHLGSGPGMIVAGSESDLPAHVEAHRLFRALSGRVRTVTLQHGLECVGFLHNERHDRTAGSSVTFAADIAVAWFGHERLHALAASQRSKLFVAGPSTMIDGRPDDERAGPPGPGMVCENLHSVRFSSERLRSGFLTALATLAERHAMIGEDLLLRPHPAGRYLERNGTPIPPNVALRDEPVYRMNLAGHGFAISAPSTILFDFMLARVPVAVCADPEGRVDTRNFAGLPVLATAEDWWGFSMAARLDRAGLVARQEAFLESLGIPKDVAGRYRNLLALAGS